jgi:hypothetical protein
VDQSNIVVLILGVVLVGVVLRISFAISQPNGLQCFILRVVLSLASAAIAAGIPGFINVEIGPGIRAGGALAVFLLVYAFNPRSLLKNPGGV